MNSLSNLPDIEFVETDVNKTLKSMINTYETVSGNVIYPADPRRLFLYAIALIIVQQKYAINDTGKMNLLKYSRGSYLDHMSARNSTYRLEAQKASAQFKMVISAAQGKDLVFSPGEVEVAAGDGMYFYNTSEVRIPKGETEVFFQMECSISGVEGNDILPGQIKNITAPFQFFKSIENITTTEGGIDEETDEEFRERIRIAPEAFSTAGPDTAYKYLAKSAHPSIKDVSVDSPSRGVVKIVPLVNGISVDDAINKILQVCADKKSRPLTDQVICEPPTVSEYNLDLTYYLPNLPDTEVITVKENIDTAIEQYIMWQSDELGRNINPSKLTAMIMAAGASRVDIRSPLYEILGKFEIAALISKNIEFGGYEND